MKKALRIRVDELAEALKAQGLKLATAESCTGGGIAQTLTELAGSSTWFECGFVTYSNESKQRMLGVSSQTLDQNGAVSDAVVAEMAMGAVARSEANVAVAVSGIAGPDGGTEDKPVGTVWLAWSREGQQVVSQCFHFQGDREAVRCQSIDAAIEGLLALIKAK